MPHTTITPEQQRDEIITDSIGRGVDITLTHRLPRGWQVFRSKLLSGSLHSGKIIVAKPVAPHDTEANTPPVGSSLGVLFRTGHKKCMFGTIREPDPPEAEADQITLCWPDHLQRLRRRAYQRVGPPPGCVVAVQFWRTSSPDGKARETRKPYYGELEDISAGGMRVDAADAAGLTAGDTFECLFVPQRGVPPIILEAVLRHHEAASEGRASLGFQFIGLETTPEGRELLRRLARTVNDYQRSRQ